MLAKTKEFNATTFNLDRMKNSVEGVGSKTAITLKGKMSANDVMKVLINVKTKGLSS